MPVVVLEHPPHLQHTGADSPGQLALLHRIHKSGLSRAGQHPLESLPLAEME